MCYCPGVTHSKISMHEVPTLIRFSVASNPSFQFLNFFCRLEKEGGPSKEERKDMENVQRCPICSELKHKKLIMSHTKLVPYTKKEKCDLCELMVNTTEDLQAHIGKVHTNKEILIHCDVCKRVFKISRRQITKNVICTIFRRVMTISVNCAKTPIPVRDAVKNVLADFFR